MLSQKLLLKYAPDIMDSQVHINHEGCSAGEDKKKRLYIKRVSGGVLGYCHHCGQKGFARDKHTIKYITSKPLSLDYPIPSTKSLPKFGDISTEGKMWLWKYYTKINDKYFKGIIGDTHKLALCIYDPEEKLLGYQYRNLSKIPGSPKYVTQYITTDRGNSAWFIKDTNKKLVITEDYLSAYRVYQDTEYSSLALLGTSITDKTITTLNNLKFSKILIWTDPDEPGIKASSKIFKKLEYYLDGVRINIIRHKEPKYFTSDELVSELSKH